MIHAGTGEGSGRVQSVPGIGLPRMPLPAGLTIGIGNAEQSPAAKKIAGRKSIARTSPPLDRSSYEVLYVDRSANTGWQRKRARGLLGNTGEMPTRTIDGARAKKSRCASSTIRRAGACRRRHSWRCTPFRSYLRSASAAPKLIWKTCPSITSAGTDLTP